MADTRGITISIMGREFRVACPEGEEKQLLASVDFVNGRMKEIRDSGKVVGNERIAIMAALNITHEFLSQRGKGVPSAGGADLSDVKKRVAALEARIDEVMAEQDKLF